MTFSERSQITSDFEVQQRWRRAGGATLIFFFKSEKAGLVQARCRKKVYMSRSADELQATRS